MTQVRLGEVKGIFWFHGQSFMAMNDRTSCHTNGNRETGFSLNTLVYVGEWGYDIREKSAENSTINELMWARSFRSH